MELAQFFNASLCCINQDITDAPVITKNLFSRHYLESRLKTLPVWREQIENERAFNEIKKLYEKEKSLLPIYDEPQLEKNFIRPVLQILGHTFEVQQSSDKSQLTPDYAFFPDERSRIEAQENKWKREFYKKAIAVCDAKKWGIPLDRKSKGRALYEYTNPSYQIDTYIRDTGVAWGILTDGRFWRLYYKEERPVENYYEIDLKTVLDNNSKADFNYFYLFFRKEAFLKDASGKNFLEKVYSEGVDYAQKVSEDLKNNVYRALKILAQGFLAWKANNLTPTEEAVKKIHENSLIALYRILFILYADSRGLLKIPKTGYEDYSITRLKALAFNKKQEGSASEHSPSFWLRFKGLFKLIDEGSEARGIPKEELYVPPYNGGLFRQDGEYKFLSEKNVGDKYVVNVLELLTVSGEEGNKGFIDYSTLEIRHLGSIYEGLLEYTLKVAEENLVATKEKDKQVWISKNKANGKKILDEAKKGELYLVTEKGERKATGSYYTPDYIVKYIVENTLSPIVEEKLKGAATDEEKIEKILSIKVLDPAMGSGHFLVEATNFLANKILPFITPEKLKEEKEIDWAKREVVKRCIYGVDLNPLATELAKLSLWLATIGEERPLSFLDHHLKVGNSLIGTNLQKLSKPPEEVKSATAPTLLSDFMDKDVQDKIETLINMHVWIMERAQETIQDIKNIEDVFKQFETNPFRQAFVEFANLHTSYWLGNKFSKEEYYEALEAFRQFSKDRSKWGKVKEKEYFRKAQQIAKEKNFFHWNLEFPDIFFGVDNPGFNVVIGNPPYVRQEQLGELKKFLSEYYEVYHGVADLYTYFFERGHKILRHGGQFGFISSNKFTKANYGKALRIFLKNENKIKEIIDFGDLPVFEDAATMPAIIITARIKTDKQEFKFAQIETLQFDSLQNEVKRIESILGDTALEGDNWSLATAKKIKIISKMRQNGIPLRKYVNGKINYGIKTGFNEAFIIDSKIRDRLIKEDEKSAEIIKPFVVGDDVRKYEINIQDRFLIFTWRGINIDEYPAIKRHLEQFKEELMPKPPDWDDERDGKWNGRKPGSYEWYEIQDTVAYHEDFEKPKIIYPVIAREQRFAFDTEGYYSNDKTFIIPVNDLFLLSILNSKLTFKFAQSMLSGLLGKEFEFRAVHLSSLPIRHINFTTSKEERSKLVEELKSLYSEGDFSAVLIKTEECLPQNKEGDFITEKEKSDVVHDFLAFLAEQMIEMNKHKNSEIKGFVSWLEREIGAKIEDLSNKTAVKEYYSGSFEDLVNVLKKNKSKLAVDPSRREFQEKKLKPEFDSSVSKLKPLMQRIEDTDKLIDQIVYKLYGLTDEEIKIVEGST